MKKKSVVVEATLSDELQARLNTVPKPAKMPMAKKIKAKRAANSDEDKKFVADYMKMQFVQELREAMAEADVTNSELARRTGKSRQAVGQALDKANPDNFTIEKMAELVCAIGARISLKVHKPGEMAVAVPVSRLDEFSDDYLPVVIDVPHTRAGATRFQDFGSDDHVTAADAIAGEGEMYAASAAG